MANDNYELLAEYKRNPSLKLRDEIFRNNKKLCFEVAHNFVSRGVAEPFEDIVQLASIGLLTAIEKYDFTRGAEFHTVAGIWMRHEVLKHIRDKTSAVKIPRTLVDIYERGRKFKRTQEQQYGYDDDFLIAESIAVPVAKWLEAKSCHSKRRAISLDELVTFKGVDDCTYDGALGLYEHHISERSEVTAGDLFLPDTDLIIEPVNLNNLDQVSLQLVQSFFFRWESITTLKKRAKQLLIPRHQIIPVLRNAVLSIKP